MLHPSLWLDILVCLDEKISLEEAAAQLERFQYKNLGECGRPGRYFLSSGDEPGKTFYLHLCHKNHPVAQDQLLFQELERSNPTIFSGYYMLKTELAAIFPDDRVMYREMKGLYIESVLSAYRMAKTLCTGTPEMINETGEERRDRRDRERERIRAKMRGEVNTESWSDLHSSYDWENPIWQRYVEHMAAEAKAESRRKAEHRGVKDPNAVYVDNNPGERGGLGE